MANEPDPQRDDDPPSVLLRTASLVALLLFLAALALSLIFLVPKFEQMFQEMELGSELSAVTKLLLLVANAIVNFWYLWLLAVAGLVWFHQKWIAKRRKRIIVFLCILFVVAAAFAMLIGIGLVEPLITPLAPRTNS